MLKKFVYALVAASSLGVLLFGANDAFVGAWKLNPTKSQFGKGQEFKDATIVITHEGDTVNVAFDMTDPTGKPLSGRYSVPSGGGKAAYTEGAPFGGLTEEVKRIDAHTVDLLYSKDGQVVVKDRITVTHNGKTMIGRVSGVDENGKPFKNIEVYDRQ